MWALPDGRAHVDVRVADEAQGQIVLGAITAGSQAQACLTHLRPGGRVALEGTIRPQARPAEIAVQRVQLLATGARAA